MGVKWKPGDYDGYSRPWLVLRRYETASDNPKRLTVVERLVPRLRDWVDMGLTLFVAGMILGAGMLLGAALLYKAVTP